MVVPATAATSYPTYNGQASSANEITGHLGMNGGAFNLGVTYVKPGTDFGLGGYFFYQTSKDKNSIPVVNQVTAIGGLVQVNLLDARVVRAYVSPGFGLAMVKDASINAAFKKSDENIIGPSFKIGVQFKTTPNFMIGLERMQFSNWFNDNVNLFGPGGEYYTAAGTFEF